MQLMSARLCLDCEELHTADHCPACASRAFAFLTQWLPTERLDRSEPPVRIPQHAERTPPPGLSAH